jgi:hypothetical protein
MHATSNTAAVITAVDLGSASTCLTPEGYYKLPDRVRRGAKSREVVPAQPVDATPHEMIVQSEEPTPK